MPTIASVRDRAGAATALAAGDVLVLVLITIAGAASHGESPIAEPSSVLGTATPFVVGWVVAAGLLATYEEPHLDPVATSRAVLGTWLGAANVGLILRASPYFDGGVTWPFPLVITGFAGIGLVAWRLVAALAAGYVESGDVSPAGKTGQS